MALQRESQTEAFAVFQHARISRALTLGLIFGLSTLIGFLYASQTYLVTRSMSMSHSWLLILVWQLLSWYVWGCLTPFILWLGRRLSLERLTWKRSLPLHILTGSFLSAAQLAAATFLTMLIRPFDVMSDTDPFRAQYTERLTRGFLANFLVYWTILGAGYAFAYYRKYRERELQASELKSHLAQAQLQALKMQLQPHFLFNTLNGIAGLVRENENKAAINMLVGLSDLLRYALENSGEQEVPLKEELDFLELYLDIEQMRFADRLRVKMDIKAETLDARVPNMILQPIVENAIRHGIAPRVSAGVIEVSASSEHGVLKISVSDDGPGLPQNWRANGSNGIGLANTRARLEQLYGAEHDFEVRNRKGAGVEVRLAIPLRFSKTSLKLKRS